MSCAGRYRPHLSLTKCLLGESIQPLGPRLRRIGAPVQLEVKLTGHRGQACRLGRGCLEEIAGPPDVYPKPMRRLDHLRLGAAASITPTEQIERPARAVPVLEVVDAALDVFRAERAVVGIGGWEVGEDPRPVDPFPYEGMVLGLVGVVPRKLLGQKEIAAGF